MYFKRSVDSILKINSLYLKNLYLYIINVYTNLHHTFNMYHKFVLAVVNINY